MGRSSESPRRERASLLVYWKKSPRTGVPVTTTLASGGRYFRAASSAMRTVAYFASILTVTPGKALDSCTTTGIPILAALRRIGPQT